METDTRYEFSPFRWSAVFAGAFLAVAIWVVLHLLGMGAGVVTTDLTDPRALRSLGIGAGAITLAAPLIALFFGGIVAARVAGPVTRVVAALHGAVLWAMATIVAGLGVVALLGTLAGGLDHVASGNGSMNKQAVAEGIAARAPGVDAEQAKEIAVRIEQGLDDMGTAAAVVDAAEDSGRVFLFAGGGLLVGLVSAMLGASIGVSRRQVRAAQIAVPGAPHALA